MDPTERRVRQEMIAAMEQVQTPSWLPAAAAAGGRRRHRRRQLLAKVPAVTAAAAVLAAAGSYTYDHLQNGRGDGAATVATVPAPETTGTTDPTITPTPAPTPTPSTTAQRAAAAEAATEELNRTRAKEQAQAQAQELLDEGKPQLAAFFGAGYVYDDAEKLAAAWNVEPSEAKTTAGAKLMADQTLPFPPGQVPVPHTSPGWQVDAFTAAGYSDTDADTLGQQWGMDSWDAKVEAGQKLLDGAVLPFPPHP